MRREKGFTLLELVAVMGTLMVLMATAIPFYVTYRQRVQGSEALVMMKRLLDAQIMYYLEHENFFPANVGDQVEIYDGDPPTKPEILQVRDALDIYIPVGHNLDYIISRPDADTCQVYVVSANNTPMFGNGLKDILATVDKEGRIDPPSLTGP
jgi:type II secretory pathway pseudopilin PulG